jgi:hypothetical protein
VASQALRTRRWIGTGAAVLVVLCASCGSTSDGGLGRPVSREVPDRAEASSTSTTDPTADTGADAVRSTIDAAASPGIRDVDWRNTTYLSACGLTEVLVVDGSGGQLRDGAAYGIDVIDVAIGDLTGDGRDDAAVLVDCLGGSEPFPHVLVVDAGGVTRPAVDAPFADRLAVVPVSGGSVAYGHRPEWIEIRPGHRLAVRTDNGVRELSYEPGVLRGGELDVTGPALYQGVLLDATDGQLTLALTPDDGYRIPYRSDLQILDVRTSVPVPPAGLVGQDLSVFVSADGVATTAQHLPPGPA